MKLKKHLGQHFLTDETKSQEIVSLLPSNYPDYKLLEVGPGGGAITKYLLQLPFKEYKMVEIDSDKVNFLIEELHIPQSKIIIDDILKIDSPYDDNFTIIGNFPYNISSQILFRVLEWKQNVTTVIGMFQKEVAVRICSEEGNKDYGILSVLMQTFFTTEYLLDVPPTSFNPPPKVDSGVVVFNNNNNKYEIHETIKYFRFIKAAFAMRRKTLRNNFKQLLHPEVLKDEIFNNRAEQLSVHDFITLYRRHYGE